MNLTTEEAVRKIYRTESISPTRAHYIDHGLREELLRQGAHLAEQGDESHATLFTNAVSQLDKDFGITASDVKAAEASKKRPEGRFVSPRVMLVGYTTANMRGIIEYLEYTGQEDFLETLKEAQRQGVEPGEALVSFYAKLCYKSLVVGQNANISEVRDIKGNIRGAQKQAHLSVFEHIGLNFVVTDCSRVATHEQVRHRVGVAYSQTSGRYCRIEPGALAIVWDPILNGCEDIFEEAINAIEKAVYLAECRKGLRKPPADYPDADAAEAFDDLDTKRLWVPTGKEDGVDFNFKKKLTSAIRRIAPNGQTNELGMSLNVRTLRHCILMRTARFAEWEIRYIYNQVYRIAKAKWPLMFADAQERMVDGLLEVHSMKMNPYDREIGDFDDNALLAEVRRRGLTVDLPEHPTPIAEVPAEFVKGSGAEEAKPEETGEATP